LKYSRRDEVKGFTKTPKKPEKKMKNLKNTITASLMIATLLFGATIANAGIVIAGATSSDPGTPCTDTSYSSTDSKKTSSYLSNLTGIVIAGFTGIVIAGATEPDPNETCGIVIAG
jgi:hypothetical protein